MGLRSILNSVTDYFRSDKTKASRPTARRATLTVEGLEGRDAPANINPYQLLAFALAANATTRPATPRPAQYRTMAPTHTLYGASTPYYSSPAQYRTVTPIYSSYGANTSPYSIRNGLGENGQVTYNTIMNANPFGPRDSSQLARASGYQTAPLDFLFGGGI